MLILRLSMCAALASFVPAQLAGTYFINPTLPPTILTFPSFADAVAALAAQGVAGPVEFLVFDDAGPYTESSQWASSNAGGTYGVPNGTPPDAVIVFGSWTGTSPTNRVTFRPAAGERVVIDATGQSCGIFWGGADYVTVQGFEIHGAAYDGISLYAEASHGVALDPIIDSCRIHDIGGPAVTIYGNVPNPTNTLVQNCTMWRCLQAGGGPFGTTGRFGYVCTRRTTGTRIVHNTFFVDTLTNNQSYGVIGAYPNGAADVPYDEFSNNVVVKLAGASAPLFRINSVAGSSFQVPTICESNCYLDASGGSFAIYGSPATTAATLLDWQIGALRDAASIEADPLFRDAAADDFHLTVLSPCIGASTAMAGVTTDADGQPRSMPFDLGADEFSAASYTSVGTGCAGTGGLTPTIDMWTWPFLGNPAFTIGFEQLPPNLFVFLFGSLGLSPAPLPLGAGCAAYLDVASFVGLTAVVSSPGGTASVVFSAPNNPAFAGFNVGYQGVVLDAGAPLGFTTTNGIDVTLDF